jgi:hypothetical protein
MKRSGEGAMVSKMVAQLPKSLEDVSLETESCWVICIFQTINHLQKQSTTPIEYHQELIGRTDLRLLQTLDMSMQSKKQLPIM